MIKKNQDEYEHLSLYQEVGNQKEEKEKNNCYLLCIDLCLGTHVGVGEGNP
jgi:hypothetical protein